MTFDSMYTIKVVAVGNGGTGKTSMIRRFALNKFDTSYLMTLGVDFTTKGVTIRDQNNKDVNIKVVVADTAGQEYYSTIRPAYYSGAQGALIVFDLTNRKSFESIPRWISEISAYLPGIPMELVGNKIDLVDSRRVTSAEGQDMAKEKNMTFFETSAKEGNGIDEVFNHLTTLIFNRLVASKKAS